MKPTRLISALLIAFFMATPFGFSQGVPFAAKVNGETISLELYESTFKQAKKQIIDGGEININQPEGQLALAQARKTILNELIKFQLLTQAAKRLNIHITEEEINLKIEEIKKGFPSFRLFKETLYEQDISLADLKHGITWQILEEKITMSLAKNIKVTKREINTYFKRNKKLFYQPKKVQALHILVRDKKLALSLHKKLLNGERFSSLAKKYSIDPLSKSNLGDLGFVEPDQMPLAFEKTLFKMRTGEISSVIKSELGYHIIKCGEIVKAHSIDPKENYVHIKKFLLSEKKRNLFQAWFDQAIDNAKIELNPDLFPDMQDLNIDKENTFFRGFKIS